MNRDRRRFVTTTATLAAAQRAGVGFATRMPIRREGNVVTAEATIGIATLGSLGVAPLFR